MASKMKVMIDDFRISHIFDIEEPISEKDLVESLQKHNYKVINDRIISHPPIRAVILNIATKNSVNISYQKESIPSYIGAGGKDMKEVLNQFDVLNNLLTQLDPTLHGRHASTEMVLAVKVFGDSVPTDTIPTLARSDTSKFTKIFNEPLKTESITMSSKNVTSESFNSIHIAPLYRSPRYYYVQLVHREKDLTKVVEFSKRAEQIIKDAITALEVEQK